MVHKKMVLLKGEKKNTKISICIYLHMVLILFILKYRCTESCKSNMKSPKNQSLTFSQW